VTDREANEIAMMTDREANELVDRLIATEGAWRASEQRMHRGDPLTGRQAIAALLFWIAIGLLPPAINACLSVWPFSSAASTPTSPPAATASQWPAWMTPADVDDLQAGLRMRLNRTMAELREELDAILKRGRDRCDTSNPRYDAWDALDYCW
jgi:hypothetical protein